MSLGCPTYLLLDSLEKSETRRGRLIRKLISTEQLCPMLILLSGEPYEAILAVS